jgi:putative NADH-flavin reductase
MRLLVLGATGHTGLQIIDLALSRSHKVTAFVRSPEKVARRHSLLTVVPGDPRNVDQLANALRGHDAVLSAIGVRPPTAFRPHRVVRECAAATVAAMSRTGVQRLALVSAAVIFPLKGLKYSFFRWLLKHIARDLSAAEDTVRRTSLEWTILRPPRLTNGPDERYSAAIGALPAHASSMSFRAVAAFMLDAVEQHAYLREIVGLGAAGGGSTPATIDQQKHVKTTAPAAL